MSPAAQPPPVIVPGLASAGAKLGWVSYDVLSLPDCAARSFGLRRPRDRALGTVRYWGSRHRPFGKI
jgi:hypothetical protein